MTNIRVTHVLCHACGGLQPTEQEQIEGEMQDYGQTVCVHGVRFMCLTCQKPAAILVRKDDQ